VKDGIYSQLFLIYTRPLASKASFLPGCIVSFDPAKPTLLTTLVRHYDELVEHIRRRFGDKSSARDVVHDVCVQLLERGEKEEVRSPLALLRKISHDTAISRYRGERRRAAWVEAASELPEIPCTAATPVNRYEAEREFQLLVDAIAALPARCQAVFVLHKIHEIPQAEVAKHLGISIKTVEKHLRLGLAACRATLGRDEVHP
jgi:RNA polymerase sigma-70 factor (ECF subfamily)